jgi:hypothetical protein
MASQDASSAFPMQSSQRFGVQSLGFWHRWTLLFVNLLVPLAVTATVFNTLNAAALVRLAIGISIVTVGLGFLGGRNGLKAWGLMMGLLIAGLYSYAAGMWGDVQLLVAFILLTLAVLFRSVRLLTAALVNDVTRLALRVDSILSVCAFVVYAAFGGTQMNTYVSQYILGGASTVALTVRLVLLWRLERLDSGSHHASSRVLLWIPLIAVLVFVVAPSLLRLLFIAIMFLDFVFTVPFIYLLSHIHLWPSKVRVPHILQGNLVLHNAHVAERHVLSGSNLRVIVFAVFVVIAVGVLFWAIRKRQSVSLGAVSRPQQVIRRRIDSLNSVKFLSTTHPVRLAYQDFIRKQSRRGRQMDKADTVRTYEQRVSPGLQAVDRRQLTELGGEYERVRYGDPTLLQKSRKDPEDGL